jgi:hypothetical protein
MHPLLENYEKYYGKKKEPKIPRIEDYEGEKTIADELKEIKEVSSLSKEQHEVLAPYLSSPYLSTTSGTSGIASISTRSNFITTSNSTVSITQKPKAIKTFDTEYSKDCFLQIAEKIKDQTAKVTCITMNADVVSNFHTGLRTIIFEVQVYDAP